LELTNVLILEWYSDLIVFYKHFVNERNTIWYNELFEFVHGKKIIPVLESSCKSLREMLLSENILEKLRVYSKGCKF
jgi:hypothetical protein